MSILRGAVQRCAALLVHDVRVGVELEEKLRRVEPVVASSHKQHRRSLLPHYQVHSRARGKELPRDNQVLPPERQQQRTPAVRHASHAARVLGILHRVGVVTGRHQPPDERLVLLAHRDERPVELLSIPLILLLLLQLEFRHRDEGGVECENGREELQFVPLHQS